ncbi:hypothetical protein HYDPIDRAFT_23011 [Hydnomerulius pinastri MD-312]|nr:hypothetical protein HYDPIDRAFT_23011 [Hydnomerulius pinastri MD-312]
MPGPFGELDNKLPMASDEYPKAPSYISARSADVILSDIRPTKLSNDALNSINGLLDELLHSILAAARALTTSQLRAGLHKVLPTTLGKEAVLEAEMELRAYWERTGGAPGSGSSQVIVDDSSFNLQWVFELLRLKCEAYSTLSDTDENSDAEARLFERMNAEGTPLPKQSLVAPASLYLTAIIESICEHILSNVGRVAARDSSRATANTQDLFIALCEDSAIYGLFKNMKVYEQIESLSKLPKPRRSKSFTRDKIGGATSLPAEPFRRDGSLNGSRPRMSSESSSTSPAAAVNPNIHSARSSIDKSRAIKIFNNRASQDLPNGSESLNGHRKTDSIASANAKQSIHSTGDKSPISPTFSEDTRSQEFDDMMRSGSTMKVSLTPDRLRTMEVFNKDKARANGRQRVPIKTEKPNGADTPSVVSSPEQPKRSGRPSLRHVDSIVEDEEERGSQKPPPTSRPRQLSAATASGYSAPSFARMRSSSTSDPSTAKSNMILPKQPLRSDSNPSPSPPGAAPVSIQRRKAPPQELDMNASRPPRTRTVARNRESLDLDDVMGDSDEENVQGLKPPAPSKQQDRQRGLSASARELIDFLAEGPPEPLAKLSPATESSLSLTPKKSGRLQKMISKITLAGSNENGKSPRKMTVGSTDAPSPNKSTTNLSPLANRPVPPRFPTSGSPSPSSSDRGSGDQEAPSTRQRTRSFIRKPVPAWNGKAPEPEPPVPSVPSLAPGMDTVSLSSSSPGTPVCKKASETDLGKHLQPVAKPTPVPNPAPLPTARAETPVPASVSVPTVVEPVPTPSPAPSPAPASAIAHSTLTPTIVHVPERLSSKAASVRPKPPPAPPTPSIPPSLFEHARDMRRMLAHATSADECRLLVDMFLTRTKLVVDSAELQSLASTPPPPDFGGKGCISNLEKTVVALFLGGSDLDYEHELPASNFVNNDAEQPEQQLEVNISTSTPAPSLPNGTAEPVESL